MSEPYAASDDSEQITSDSTPTQDAIVDRVFAAWDAVRDLLLAARGLLLALTALAQSEWHLARVSLPWVIGFAIVLVGLVLSLWLSVMALIAWALYMLTGYVGWALAGLVLLHVIGLVAVVWALKRSARLLSFPATRTEVRGLFSARDKRERAQ